MGQKGSCRCSFFVGSVKWPDQMVTVEEGPRQLVFQSMGRSIVSKSCFCGLVVKWFASQYAVPSGSSPCTRGLVSFQATKSSCARLGKCHVPAPKDRMLSKRGQNVRPNNNQPIPFPRRRVVHAAPNYLMAVAQTRLKF
jgi:hypothetical protein